MLTQTILLFLIALNTEVHTVTIDCPGIACRSRFSESIDEHIVDANRWIHSVSITYLNSDHTATNPSWGDIARLRFTIDRNRNSRELAKLLVDSGYYYGTDEWTLVERTPFSQLKTNNHKTDDSIALGINSPGKVSEVYWSDQSEVCTVQISFPSLPDGQVQPEHPKTQVWLLKSDGTAINRLQKPRTLGVSMAGHTTESTIYAFAQSAKNDAIAVVVRIDDQMFTKSLNAADD